jgi:hypothetical protein
LDFPKPDKNQAKKVGGESRQPNEIVEENQLLRKTSLLFGLMREKNCE